MESYRLKFQVVRSRFVEGDALQEVWSYLHGDGGKLTLHGLRGGLPPPCLLCLSLTAAALREFWRGEGRRGEVTHGTPAPDTRLTWGGGSATPQLPRATREKNIPVNWLQLPLDSGGNQLSLHIHSGLNFPELFYKPAKKLFCEESRLYSRL